MDYLIDDMLGSSRRSSFKGNRAAEPPLPPSPSTPLRTKGLKSARPSTGSENAVVENIRSTKAAAAIPLPPTPVPVVRVSKNVPVTSEASLQPSKADPITAVGAESDYFSVAEPVPLAEASAGLQILQQPIRTESAYFTPTAELPPLVPELAESMDEPKATLMVEPAAGIEQHEEVSQPDEPPATAKEIPEDQTMSTPSVLHLTQNPVPVVHNRPALMIGISGAPASGKTALAHMLSAILSPTVSSFIIHQGDFFVRKHLLIPDTDGSLDVEYQRTVDFPAFKRLIEYSKREATLPPGFRSLQPEVEQAQGLSCVSQDVVESLRASLAGVSSLQDGKSAVMVDGFMLYHSGTIRDLLDIKILLRARKDVSRSRYTEKVQGSSDKPRHPWATVEYFDHFLWPNYVAEHSVLFEDQVVEGQPIPDVCDRVGISVQPRLNMNLEEVLQWVVDVVQGGVEQDTALRNRGSVPEAEYQEDLDFCACRDGWLGRIRQKIFDFI